MKKNYGFLSVIVTAVALPVTVFVGAVLELVLKSRNSAHVDITSGLAYLRPLLVTTFSLFTVFVVVATALAVVGLRRDEEKQTARYALVVLAVVLVLCIGGAVAKNRVSKVEDHYSAQRVNTFFKNLLVK